jgi:hypothetical protein
VYKITVIFDCYVISKPIPLFEELTEEEKI